jgi:hypothetical protein
MAIVFPYLVHICRRIRFVAMRRLPGSIVVRAMLTCSTHYVFHLRSISLLRQSTVLDTYPNLRRKATSISGYAKWWHNVEDAERIRAVAGRLGFDTGGMEVPCCTRLC